MTLLVTSIAADEIVMVADSAATTRLGRQPPRYYRGVAKVFYSWTHNVAFGSWGVARLRSGGMDVTTDRWMAEFLTEIEGIRDLPLHDIADRILEQLSAALAEKREAEGVAGHLLPWEFLRMGVHVAGFEDEKPRLYQITTGRSRPDTGPPRIVLEHPADAEPGARRGPLGDCQHWDGDTERLEEGIRTTSNIDHDCVAYCSSVISSVAHTLAAEGDFGINTETSFVAFSRVRPRALALVPQGDWQPIG